MYLCVRYLKNVLFPKRGMVLYIALFGGFGFVAIGLWYAIRTSALLQDWPRAALNAWF